ncbi:MAG: hypothetical protein GXP16_03680 [Gammaproteobacteria bacterium]|nr:hypothetical protein [Gammaproteobacteria bacterium]
MNRIQQSVFWLGLSMVVAVVFAWIGYARPHADSAPVIGALVWTGRLAFLVFLIPLFASPVRKLHRNAFTATLMRWRRNAGITYGGIQAVHIYLIAAMFLGLDEPPVETAMVIIGGLGMLLVVGMLVTSFEGPTRWLGPRRWRALHKAGFHVFMFIYFYDFVVEPILLGTSGDYAFFAALTLFGMGVRVLVMLQRKISKTKSTTA